MQHRDLFLLTLGCDFRDETGDSLGKRTVGRIDRAVKYAKEHPGSTLVVVSIKSANHPKQEKTMGQMMACCLKRKCHPQIVLENPKGALNTVGEIEAFMDYLATVPGARGAVVSAPFHLTRIRLMVRKYYGKEVADALEYLPVEQELPSPQDRFREPIKYLSLCLPRSWQDTLGTIYRSWFG